MKIKYILFQKEVFCSEFVIVLKLNQLVFLQYIGAGCGGQNVQGANFLISKLPAIWAKHLLSHT